MDGKYVQECARQCFKKRCYYLFHDSFLSKLTAIYIYIFQLVIKIQQRVNLIPIPSN